MTEKSINISISVPAAMLAEIEQVCRGDHRTRSEFFREAARYYLYRRRLPGDYATPEELAALERGRREIARGQYATLAEVAAEFGYDVAAKDRPKRRKKSP